MNGGRSREIRRYGKGQIRQHRGAIRDRLRILDKQGPRRCGEIADGGYTANGDEITPSSFQFSAGPYLSRHAPKKKRKKPVPPGAGPSRFFLFFFSTCSSLTPAFFASARKPANGVAMGKKIERYQLKGKVIEYEEAVSDKRLVNGCFVLLTN